MCCYRLDTPVDDIIMLSISEVTCHKCQSRRNHTTSFQNLFALKYISLVHGTYGDITNFCVEIMLKCNKTKVQKIIPQIYRIFLMVTFVQWTVDHDKKKSFWIMKDIMSMNWSYLIKMHMKNHWNAFNDNIEKYFIVLQ